MYVLMLQLLTYSKCSSQNVSKISVFGARFTLSVASDGKMCGKMCGACIVCHFCVGQNSPMFLRNERATVVCSQN